METKFERKITEYPNLTYEEVVELAKKRNLLRLEGKTEEEIATIISEEAKKVEEEPK